MGFNSPEYLDSVKKIMEASQQKAKEQSKQEKRRANILRVGKWVADNIVAIGALIVAIIALIRTV